MKSNHGFDTWHNGLVFLTLLLVSSNDLIDIAIGHPESRFNDRLGDLVAKYPTTLVDLHNG